VLLAAIVVATLVRVASTHHVFAAVVDEPVHIAAGYDWVVRHSNAFDPVHPPLARLVCVRLDGPISEEDVHALERVAIVAALLITRQSAVLAVENKYQGDFLRDLLVRGTGEESYVEEHASARRAAELIGLLESSAPRAIGAVP